MNDNNEQLKMELPLFTAKTRQSMWQRQSITTASVILGLFVGGAFIGVNRPREERRRLQAADYPQPPRSTTLQWCLFAALSVGIAANLALFVLIIKYRTSPSVKAAQPIGQSIIALAGAVALAGGICLVAPPSFVTCAIVEPLIFISMSTIGSGIVGMAWRVECVVAPILMLGGRSRRLLKDDKESKFAAIKRRNTAFLTLLARNPCRKTTPKRLRPVVIRVRQKVTNKRLVRLIGCLILPQIVLQSLTLALPSLRSYPALGPDDQCTHLDTAWPTVLGSILTALPILSAVIITTKEKGGVSIPPVLNEASAIRSIIFYFTLFSVSTAPILAFDATNTNQSTYIYVYLLLGAVLPVAYFITWPKLRPICRSTGFVDILEQIVPSRRPSFHAADEHDNQMRLENAQNIFDQGKIFEEMDMPNNSIKLYDEALAMWHSDSNVANKHFTGDFSASEIESIRSASNANLLASLLTSKATFYEKGAVLKAAKCYLKAIEIFEFSPAMTASLSGRSAIFPCFHSIFRFIRDGKLESDIVFEKALAARFVQETEESNDFHHACALAINAEMKFRSGLPLEAIKEFAKMEKIHTVADSKKIREASGLEICALAYSRSALWHMEMGNEFNAMKQCEVVIKMLNNLRPKDPKEAHALLTPIIAILGETQTSRMSKLYEDHAVKLGQGSMPLFVRNMRFVLTTGNGFGIDNDTSWVLAQELSEHHEADYFSTLLGLSVNTTAAEACLVLAQQRSVKIPDMSDSFCEGRSQTLLAIDKGFRFAMFANQGMKENDQVISEVANAKNQSVLTSLQTLADDIGCDLTKGPSAKTTKMLIHKTESQKFRRSIGTLQLKAKKTLPHTLLLSHDTAAFVGLTHDSLASVFRKALSEEPRRKWERICIFYVSDSLMDNFKEWRKESVEGDQDDTCAGLIQKKRASQEDLDILLRDKAGELCFYEITHHCSFFGSFFGWGSPGGYIHVSPSIWGVGVKMCPSNGYRWELGARPSHEFLAYRKGLENLLSSENPFAMPL